MKPIHVVAVGAHPDDIELSMAGMLLRYAKAGHRITWIVATDGAAGTGSRDAELAGKRSAEAVAAANYAGASLIQCAFPDGQLAWRADAPAVIGHHLADLKPDLIVTHACNDYHTDHRAVARIVGDTAPINVPILRSDNMLGLYFTPDFLVDIGAVFENKLGALSQHKSQATLSLGDALTVWNRFRGLQSSARRFTHAEAYSFDRRLTGELLPLLDRIGGYVML